MQFSFCRCMYISGVPGTGKTATVNETVRGLEKLVKQGEIDDFNFVSVNGMKLSEPRQAYVQILKQLEGKNLTWEQAQRALEKKFKGKSSRQMTLLLVDEVHNILFLILTQIFIHVSRPKTEKELRKQNLVLIIIIN